MCCSCGVSCTPLSSEISREICVRRHDTGLYYNLRRWCVQVLHKLYGFINTFLYILQYYGVCPFINQSSAPVRHNALQLGRYLVCRLLLEKKRRVVGGQGEDTMELGR